MSDFLFVFLHGFLGKGEDGKPLLESLAQKWPKYKIETWCPSLLSGDSPIGPQNHFNSWPLSFNKGLEKFNFHRCIIIGYSMGGRLALNAVRHFPKHINGAILLSTHPVALPPQVVEIRSERDRTWRDKFLKQDWSELIQEWNQQEVFAGETQHPVRRESDFSREALALALQNWSVLEQNLTWEDIKSLEIPCLWMAGAKDEKYVQTIEVMKAQGLPGSFSILPGRGHRIGFELDSHLLADLHNFLDPILS